MKWIIIKRSKSVLAQASERRLLLGSLGVTEQGCNAPNTRVLSRKEYMPPAVDDIHGGAVMIIKRSESVLAQGSECRLLLGALGEAEQSAKRKAQRCFAPKGV